MSETDALAESPTAGPETTLEVGAPLPRLAAVRPLDGHRIAVTWANGARAGTTEEVDLAPVVMTLKFYAPPARRPAAVPHRRPRRRRPYAGLGRSRSPARGPDRHGRDHGRAPAWRPSGWATPTSAPSCPATG